MVQGTPQELDKLTINSVVVAVHPVPIGLLVHPLLKVIEDGSIMVEILGWKDDNLQRHMEPGLGLESSHLQMLQVSGLPMDGVLRRADTGVKLNFLT